MDDEDVKFQHQFCADIEKALRKAKKNKLSAQQVVFILIAQGISIAKVNFSGSELDELLLRMEREEEK